MNFKDMNIGTRLGLGFSMLLALALGLAGLGLWGMNTLNHALVDVVENNSAKMVAAANLRDAERRVAISVRDVALLSDEAEMAEKKRGADRALADYDKNAAILEKGVTSPEGKELLAAIGAGRSQAMPLIERAMTLAQNNEAVEATRVLMQEIAPAARRWQEAIDAMITYQVEQGVLGQQQAKHTYVTASGVLLVLAGLAVVLGALIAWLATRSITRPLQRALMIAQTVAAGDLTSQIEVDSRDETGQLLQALKDMNASLVNIVGQVRGGTEMIGTASSEIATGNFDLSARTEQQASSLEETASSMEELTSTVKQNSDNARQANQLAASASEIAVKGGQVVAEVVGTMASINESSKKIVDIIAVIDGIAFQTNILALNAAVEAARAGEQGRGFAVVATEVRNLAQRSASAAKEIKMLIDTSVAKVDAGSRLVTRAGSTMDEIVSSVQRVTDIMGEIASASAEQEAGIEQINQAISEMDTVTQQNAALVEQAAAAAAALQEQAVNLEQVVGVFKMHSTGRASVQRQSAKPAPLAPAARSGAPRRLAVAKQAGEDWEQF